MRDPVMVIPTGRTYDKATLDTMKNAHFQMEDPIDRTPLVYTAPNVNLKESIQRFLGEHPELRSFLEPEKNSEECGENVSCYTVDEFAMIFVKHATYAFPENTEVRLYNGSRRLIWLAEAGRQTNVDPQTTHRLFLDILNDALLPFALRVKTFTAKNLKTIYHLSDTRTSNYLLMKSTEKIMIETDKGNLITSPKNLFSRMMDSRIDRITIAPDQKLILGYLNKYEHEVLKKISNAEQMQESLLITLLSYLPYDYVLNLDMRGTVQLICGSDKDIGRCVQLSSENGTIVISLNKKES